MTNGRLKPLGDLVRNLDYRRIPLSSRERAKRRGPYPYYGATGVMDYLDDYLFEGLHLLIAEDGSVETDDGRPFLQLVDGKFWVNNHAHVVRGATDEETRYLFYALNIVPIRPFMSGSVQAKLSQANLNRIPVPYPEDEAERRIIAGILGALDEKIELNRRMIETLEAMARALFKSWFVDFDHVRFKAEDRDPGLSQTIADLFPDCFEDSELGEIPAGWQSSTLADFAQLNPESWSRTNRPETFRYVDLSNTKWGRIDAIATHQAESAPSRAQRVLRTGDTIVGTVRPGNGSYALVSEEGLTGSTGFAVLRPKRSYFIEFVYLAASDQENIETLAHLADGAAYPAVRPEAVIATPVVSPSEVVVAHFSNVVGPLLQRMANADAESRTLADLRDTILPKLISGEIRVPPAERSLEAAPA